MREFQSVIGRETIEQSQAQFGRLPDVVVACVGGGSNAAGMFYPFVEHPGVELVGVEAGGRGVLAGEHAAKVLHVQLGIFEGYRSYFLQDGDGNIASTHSVSAGLELLRR